MLNAVFGYLDTLKIVNLDEVNKLKALQKFQNGIGSDILFISSSSSYFAMLTGHAMLQH